MPLILGAKARARSVFRPPRPLPVTLTVASPPASRKRRLAETDHEEPFKVPIPVDSSDPVHLSFNNPIRIDGLECGPEDT